eukprot:scaffold7161_cov109-Isochrysis_galbana.AAC.6
MEPHAAHVMKVAARLHMSGSEMKKPITRRMAGWKELTNAPMACEMPVPRLEMRDNGRSLAISPLRGGRVAVPDEPAPDPS